MRYSARARIGSPRRDKLTQEQLDELRELGVKWA
jgi:hypothetical protein